MRFHFVLVLLLLISCNKPNDVEIENGVITRLEHLWEKSRSDGQPLTYSQTNFYNVTHQGFPLMNIGDNVGIGNLRKVDPINGKDVWSWNEFSGDSRVTNLLTHFTSGDKLVFRLASGYYCIDMSTGESIWTNTSLIGKQSLAYKADKFYFPDGYLLPETGDTLHSIVYSGDINTGALEPFLEYTDPGIVDLDEYHFIQKSTMYNVNTHTYENQDFLLIDGADPLIDHSFPGGKITQRHISLYNLTTESWVYEKAPVGLPEGTNGGMIIVDEDRVYIAPGRMIESYDLLTGEQVWSNPYPHTFTFSGINIIGDKLLGNCENGMLFCVDKATGYYEWLGEGAGTSNMLVGRVLNGVQYYTGGSPSRLFAIDVKTGKTLWKIDASEYEGPGTYWQYDLYVTELDGVGRVIACTADNCYAFAAER